MHLNDRCLVMTTEQHKDFIGRAEQEARVLRYSRMIPEGRISLAVVDDIVDLVRNYARSWNFTNAAIARAVGTSQTYISNLFDASTRDKIPDDSRDGLVRALNTWIENEGRKREILRPSNFVMTGPARRLVATGVMTIQIGCIGVANGGPGIGKSETCRWIGSGECPKISGAVAIELASDEGRGPAVRERIFEAVRGRRTQRRPMVRHLVDRLRGRSLLIIDQAHNLKDSALLDLQSLHDAAGLPILLVGTQAIDDRTSDDDDPLFGQLSSRIGIRTDLVPASLDGDDGTKATFREWISLDDLRRMFELEKIKLSDDALRMLLEIALFQKGALRRCKYLVTAAAAAVRGANRSAITAADLIAAGAVVTGKRTAPRRRAAADSRKAATA